MSEEKSRPASRADRRPLISHNHRKRSLTTGVVSLAIIVAVIILLPRVVAFLSR